MSSPPRGELAAQLEPVVREAVEAIGFDLETLDVHQAGRRRLVKVVVDGDDGIGLDEVAEASRAVSAALDAHEHLIAGAVHARGHLARGRPPADQAAALEARAACGWSRSSSRTRSSGSAGSATPTRPASSCWCKGELRRVRVPHDRARASSRSSSSSRRSRNWLGSLEQGTEGGVEVNVDIAALRAIERDKDIPFDTVLEAIETALLTAYKHTEGHHPHSRGRDRPARPASCACSRRTSAPDGAVRRGVGRHSGGLRPHRRHHRAPGHPAAPARRRARAHLRRVLRQGGRDRRRRRAARRPGQRPRHGRRAGRRHRGRAAARPSRCPASATSTVRGIKCYVVGVSRGTRGPQITLSRTHPNLVRRLFALEVPGDRRRHRGDPRGGP